jgi:hypothetical protein
MSKNKIYDSELFIKKKWKIDQHTPKAQRKIFFTYEFGLNTKKHLFFYVFFSKSFVYSIKEIYIQIELV